MAAEEWYCTTDPPLLSVQNGKKKSLKMLVSIYSLSILQNSKNQKLNELICKNKYGGEHPSLVKHSVYILFIDFSIARIVCCLPEVYII